MILLLSTEKPSKDGSTAAFFLPLRLPRPAPSPSSTPPCGAGAGAAFPRGLAVCHSREAPMPRAARFCKRNSRAKLVTAGEEPRYMERYDSTSESLGSEKRKCESVVSSLPMSASICSWHQRDIDSGICPLSSARTASPSAEPPLPTGAASEPHLLFFFLPLEAGAAAAAAAAATAAGAGDGAEETVPARAGKGVEPFAAAGCGAGAVVVAEGRVAAALP
mmetsp:Transcript_50169/g.115798  ORF Transcript_50169/g.115798 Transcript_50169/m.115798 type:complete len:220 (+) Transcript_50169:376-1035(+)